MIYLNTLTLLYRDSTLWKQNSSTVVSISSWPSNLLSPLAHNYFMVVLNGGHHLLYLGKQISSLLLLVSSISVHLSSIAYNDPPHRHTRTLKCPILLDSLLKESHKLQIK